MQHTTAEYVMKLHKIDLNDLQQCNRAHTNTHLKKEMQIDSEHTSSSGSNNNSNDGELTSVYRIESRFQNDAPHKKEMIGKDNS